MESKKILYVINKKSGADDNADIESLITNLGSESEKEQVIFHLSGDNDEAKIRKEINEYKPDIVVAGGGDGTVNLVASVIKGMPVKFGILPLGSANGLANESGIPSNIEEAARLIINGKAKPMDLIRINDDRISLHLSDFGINARIVKEFEKEGKRGFRGYIKHFFNEMIQPQKSFRCFITIDNKVITHKALMLIIANASSYRSGANINPQGNIDDGKFEIVVFKPHQRWVWKSLIGAFTGTLHEQPNIETYKCTSAIISVNPPQEFQIDGESLGKRKEVRANIEKHALNVILPSEQ